MAKCWRWWHTGHPCFRPGGAICYHAAVVHALLHLRCANAVIAQYTTLRVYFVCSDGSTLQVYFVCSDGSLFALCPVAPFQAALPLSDVGQLVEISRGGVDESAHSTTQAWLDQVTFVQQAIFPLPFSPCLPFRPLPSPPR